MPPHAIFAMPFAKVYPMYIQKAERKNRTKEEVDQIICWFLGYDQTGLRLQIDQGNDLETFFAQAPAIHPNRSLIKGVVCGVRIEEIDDPLMQKIRCLDKLIDELAKGKSMDKILRQSVVAAKGGQGVEFIKKHQPPSPDLSRDCRGAGGFGMVGVFSRKHGSAMLRTKKVYHAQRCSRIGTRSLKNVTAVPRNQTAKNLV